MRTRFTENNFITVPGFAIVRHGLSGNELLLYSLIYGFSQDGDSDFRGSLSYIAEALNVSRNTAKNVLDSLIGKGLIKKNETYINGVKFCHYSTQVPLDDSPADDTDTEAPAGGVQKIGTGAQNAEDDSLAGVQNFGTGCTKNLDGGVQKIGTNNNIDININKDNSVCADIQQRAREHPEAHTHTLFYESFESVGAFRAAMLARFPRMETAGVDFEHYYKRMDDYSRDKGVRSADWTAKARQFINGDLEKGELRRISREKPASSTNTRTAGESAGKVPEKGQSAAISEEQKAAFNAETWRNIDKAAQFFAEHGTLPPESQFTFGLWVKKIINAGELPGPIVLSDEERAAIIAETERLHANKAPSEIETITAQALTQAQTRNTLTAYFKEIYKKDKNILENK